MKEPDVKLHAFAAAPLWRGRVASPMLGHHHPRESHGTYFTGDWLYSRISLDMNEWRKIFTPAPLVQPVVKAPYRLSNLVVVCPFWVPNSSLDVSKGSIMVGSVRVFPKFHPINILYDSNLYLHVISLPHSFISCHPSPHSFSKIVD